MTSIKSSTSGTRKNFATTPCGLFREGHTVGVCGKMNVKYSLTSKASFCRTPEPDIKASPDDLNTFFRFIQVNVQEHTNKKVPQPERLPEIFSYMVSHDFAFHHAFDRVVYSPTGSSNW